jgi:hypothetical protein
MPHVSEVLYDEPMNEHGDRMRIVREIAPANPHAYYLIQFRGALDTLWTLADARHTWNRAGFRVGSLTRGVCAPDLAEPGVDAFEMLDGENTAGYLRRVHPDVYGASPSS